MDDVVCKWSVRVGCGVEDVKLPNLELSHSTVVQCNQGCLGKPFIELWDCFRTEDKISYYKQLICNIITTVWYAGKKPYTIINFISCILYAQMHIQQIMIGLRTMALILSA